MMSISQSILQKKNENDILCRIKQNFLHLYMDI